MYGDFMMMVDSMIGRVVNALEETGMYDDTLLVFTSDNGPTWYEKDVERFGHDSSGGLRGMKADAWEAGHRMPFIVRWPGRVHADSESQQTICFTDLLATFASIVDVELPAEAGPDSFDFSTVLLDTQPTDTPIRDSLVLQSGTGLMTVRKGDWKLIEGLGSGGFTKPSRITPGPDDPKGQLYNLADDPAETTNLYKEKPEVVEELQAELARVREAARTRP